MRGLVIALSLSVGLHGLAFSVLPIGEAPMVAGGGPGATLRLGNGFADLAAGQSAVAVVATSPVVPISPDSVALRVTAVQPVGMQASEPVVASKVEPAETVEGHEPQPKAQPKPGAETNQRAGQADGAETGQATTRTETANAGSDGGAKASNYPGLVMKKLMKTRKDRVSGRGTALVGFTLGSDGSIATAKIVRSSGSDAIDKAALALVARASPFPPPPKGAERSFSFEFSGG